MDRLLDRIANLNRLTRREQELLDALTAGVGTNKELAERLGCSVRTVDSHLRQLFAKTGTHSKVELVVHALTRSNDVR